MNYAHSSPDLKSTNQDGANIRRTSSLQSLYTKKLYQDIPFVAVSGLPRTSADFDVMQHDLQMSTNADNSSEPEILEQGYTLNLVLASFTCLLSAFQYGFNISVVNAAADYVFPDHSDIMWALVVSFFGVGGLIGAYCAGVISNKYGRKQVLLATSVLMIISSLLMGLAPNIGVLILGRFLVGVACGTTTVFVPLYLGEIAPPNLRGTLGTCNQFSVVFGILIADVLAFPLAKEHLWRYLMGFSLAPAALQIIMSCFLLESPRYLLLKSKKEEAKRLLQKFRNRVDVDDEVDGILAASENDPKEETKLLQAFRYAPTRLALLIGIGLQVTQQFSGINAVFYYSSSFFQDTGVISDSKVGTLVIGIVNALAVVVAVILIDKAGRKPLLLSSCLGMAISCMVISFALISKQFTDVADDVFNYITLIFINIYVIFFEIGLGPIPWLLIAELFPTSIRTTGMSAATFVNWTCNCIIGLAYPYDADKLGNFSWIPFCIVLWISFFLSYKYVFETRGKTLEQIEGDLCIATNTEKDSMYQSLVSQPFVTQTQVM